MTSRLARLPGVRAAVRRMADAVQAYGPQRPYTSRSGQVRHVGSYDSPDPLIPRRPVVPTPRQLAEARHDRAAGSAYLIRYLGLVRTLVLGGRGLRPAWPAEIMRRWNAYRPDTTRTQSVYQMQGLALEAWEQGGEILLENTGDGFTLRDSLDLWSIAYVSDDRIIRDSRTLRPLGYPFEMAGVVVPAERMTGQFNLGPGEYRGRSITWPALRSLRLLYALDVAYSHAAIGTSAQPVALEIDEDTLLIYVDPETDEQGIREMVQSAATIRPGDVKIVLAGKMKYTAIEINPTLPEYYEASRGALLEEAATLLGVAKETLRASFSDGVFASLKAAYRENHAMVDGKRRIIEDVTRPMVADFIRTLPPHMRREAMRIAEEQWQMPVFLSLDEGKQAGALHRYQQMGAISVRQVQREIDVDPEQMAMEIAAERAAAPEPEPEPAADE